MSSNTISIVKEQPRQLTPTRSDSASRTNEHLGMRTAMIGATGAILSGSLSILGHKSKMKDSTALEKLNQDIVMLEESSRKTLANSEKYILNSYKNGKIPWKAVGVNAAFTAGLCVCFSLAYEGIKHLFSNQK